MIKEANIEMTATVDETRDTIRQLNRQISELAVVGICVELNVETLDVRQVALYDNSILVRLSAEFYKRL